MQYLDMAKPLGGPRIALFCKPGTLNHMTLKNVYMGFLESLGVSSAEVVAVSMQWLQTTTKVSELRTLLPDYLELMENMDITVLYVTDAKTFQALTGAPKVTAGIGEWQYCILPKYATMKVTYGYSTGSMIMNPAQQPMLELTLQAAANALRGNQKVSGARVLLNTQYPETLQEVQEALDSLYQYPSLTVDIEAFSLLFWEAGIGTIAFAWDKHSGIAFTCDFQNQEYVPNPEIRGMLKKFFTNYRGKICFHGSNYDAKVLIYVLWMQHPQDIQGLLTGLHTLFANLEDTFFMAYLSLNSTSRNSLSLKTLAKPYAGNWALDEITDIRKYTRKELLEYNLVDACCTWYVWDTYGKRMTEEDQEAIYRTLFLPSQKTITQMSLVGMPMNPVVLDSLEERFALAISDYQQQLQNLAVIQQLNSMLQMEAMHKKNATLKVKQHPLSAFQDVVFNPGSTLHMQKLLYTLLGLPVVDYTDTGEPAVGGDTLGKLQKLTQDPDTQHLLEMLRQLAQHTKIQNTFIKAFQEGFLKTDGFRYLHGSFVLGGTVSGRLSSRDPNLQNLPAHGKLAKLIKSAFYAPPGWIFCGADFASLEDRINALLTKDTNKIKVYTENFDGHCLRAYAYFGDQMPDIVNTVESINSIADRYPLFRQESKAPTFALTYQGTYKTLMTNQGWSEEKAKMVEDRYHQLYAESDQWVHTQIDLAYTRGYGLGAFGLKIRTPLLAQSIRKGRNMSAVAAEERTLGNAISGQSYGLLTNRAVNAFMQLVWASRYRYSILPVCLIHDAIYLMIKDDPEVLEFTNTHLIREMEWQDLPEIAHPDVHLGAELDVFYNGWHQPITLPNNAPSWLLQDLCRAGARKYET